MSFQSYQDLMLWRPPQLAQFIGNGILYETNKLVIFAEPKLGKSVLALQISFCICTGIPVLNFTTSRHRVAYLQAEVSPTLFRDRTLKTGHNVTVPPQSLYFSTRRDIKLDRESGIKDLEQTLVKIAHRDGLLIIDPIYKFLSSPDEGSILRFTDNIDYLIDKYNLTIILIHHSRKPRTTMSGALIDQGGSELRGPIFEAWADGIIRMKGDPLADDRTLTFELRHAPQLVDSIDIQLDRNRLWYNRI